MEGTARNIFGDQGNMERNFWEQGNSVKVDFEEHLNLFLRKKGTTVNFQREQGNMQPPPPPPGRPSFKICLVLGSFFLHLLFPIFYKEKWHQSRQPNWYKKTEPLTENRSVEINNYKFNHCSIPSDHVMPQRNNVNLSLRLRMTSIFFQELVPEIK